jgi:hypothetical protein
VQWLLVGQCGMSEAVAPRPRLAISVLLGVLAGWFSYLNTSRPEPRDFTAVWRTARAILDHQDPAAVSRTVFYPLPSILGGVPWALIPTVDEANALFMMCSAAAFAWALMEHGYAPLLGFFAAGMAFAAEVVQWTPIFAGAYALAPLSVFLVVKPHMGLPIFLARPSWWPVGGAVVVTCAAFVIDPAWITHWREGMAIGGAHLGPAQRGFPYSPPILLPGGAVALLAILRWRRPEARLLVALACVPQSLLLYETVPLALVPRTVREASVFTGLSYIVLWYLIRGRPYADIAEFAVAGGRMYALLLYIPLTIMVLRRPNAGRIPRWVEARIVRWPAWARGMGDPS